MRIPLALAALTLAAGGLAAQTLRPSLGVSVVAAHVVSVTAVGTQELAGPLFEGGGALHFGPAFLTVAYQQGTLTASDGSGATRDLVEGTAALGAKPWEWLALATAVHARAYALSSGTERWLFWELHARLEAPFIGSAARGHVELWRAFSADVNVPETFDHAQGGEVGMTVQFSHMPIAARLAYRIDHAALGDGSRRETVAGVFLGVHLSSRTRP